MKTRHYLILIVLTILSSFCIVLIFPAVTELQKSYEIGKTLSGYTKEVNAAVKEHYSYETSEGYKLRPSGQEKVDEVYNVVQEKREKLYNSDDSFTKYFSNLSSTAKLSFIVSKIIAIAFYLAIMIALLLFIVKALIFSYKKSKVRRKSERQMANKKLAIN